MSTFTHGDVQRLATLARLELSTAEIEMFTRQLGDVLEFVRQIQGVDTTAMDENALTPANTVTLREDAILPCLQPSDVLATAPEADLAAGLFKVPRVLNG